MKKILMLSCIIAGSVCSFAQTGNYAAGTNAGNTGSYNYNTSVGHSAGDFITSHNGSYFGYEAGGLVTNAAGSFFGYQSGKSNTGSSNSFFGSKTGTASTGGSNMFAGFEAGMANTSGSSGVFIGYRAGYANTTGASNTFIGYRAGYSNATGIGNVFIGANAGYNETGSNKLFIENSSGATPLIYGDFSTNSVGINTATPGSYTLNVNGTLNASNLHVAGEPYLASQWTTTSSNLSYAAGGISVGTTTLPTGYKLAVGGKLIAEEVVVQLQASWPDYVFETDYMLRPIEELELYINQHKHLPGVPSAREIKDNGISVGEMNTIMMEKIEELTLYIIELKKEVELLKKNVN
jgi:hypothetical protein